MSTKGKVITWIVAVLLVAGAVFGYFKFYFVFGEGVKAGELNQIVYKGWIWKTYGWKRPGQKRRWLIRKPI